MVQRGIRLGSGTEFVPTAKLAFGYRSGWCFTLQASASFSARTSMAIAAWQTIPDMNQPCLTELSLFSVVFLPSLCPPVIFCVLLWCPQTHKLSAIHPQVTSFVFYSLLQILRFSPSFLVGFSISSFTFCVFYCCSRGLTWNGQSCFSFVVNSSCAGLGYLWRMLLWACLVCHWDLAICFVTTRRWFFWVPWV